MTYRDTVLADAPTHYWEMPFAGGAVVQDLGSAPSAMIGRSGANSGYGAQWDGGLALDCGGGTLLSSNTQQALVAPFSVECWVWIFSFNSASSLAFGHDGNSANSAWLRQTAAGLGEFAADGVASVSGAALTAEAWHHLVGTYSGGSARLFVDTVGQTAVGGGGAVATPLRWAIGGASNGTAFFNGLVASCAVYGAVLNGSQISAHYNAANNRLVFPAFLGTAGITIGSGGTPNLPLDQTVQAIYNSVRKAY